MANTPMETGSAVDMSALSASLAQPLPEIIENATPVAPTDATTVFLFDMAKLDAAKASLHDGETLHQQNSWNNIGRNNPAVSKHRPGL